MLRHCTTVFPSVDYAFTTIPTYPSGQIGFLMCSTSPNTVLRVPARTPPPEVQAQLKYAATLTLASTLTLTPTPTLTPTLTLTPALTPRALTLGVGDRT